MSSVLELPSTKKILCIADQLCAIVIKSDGAETYVGIGKIKLLVDNKVTVQFEWAAHLKESDENVYEACTPQTPPLITGLLTQGHTMHFHAQAVYLNDQEWQRISAGRDEILISFQESEIKKMLALFSALSQD